MECEYKFKYKWLSLFIAFLVQQCWIRLYFIQLFSQHREIAGDLKYYDRNAIWVSKWNEFWNYWVLISASWTFLGFSLALWDIAFLDKDLSVSDLDLLETGIDSFPVNFFFCLQEVWKTTSRNILKMSRRHFLKTSSA